jgi:transcriptional regulator with XRE-family HTH domain
MSEKKQPNPVDVYVGSRVRMRRMMLGMTQEKLGDQLGITFQQVQKYEKGANRIGASRLQQISRILDVPVAFFFEDVQHATEPAGAFAEERPASYIPPTVVSHSDDAALTKAFSRISDPRVRRRVIDLVETLADSHRY